MFDSEYKERDRIKFGDTEFRLAETENGARVIQLWSSLSKQWVTSTRRDTDTKWEKLKVFYAGLEVRRN